MNKCDKKCNFEFFAPFKYLRFLCEKGKFTRYDSKGFFLEILTTYLLRGTFHTPLLQLIANAVSTTIQVCLVLCLAFNYSILHISQK